MTAQQGISEEERLNKLHAPEMRSRIELEAVAVSPQAASVLVRQATMDEVFGNDKLYDLEGLVP